MSEDLFRKKAMERLSSPDELDSLMKITSPKGWIALLSLIVIIVFIIIWSITGSLPDKVIGQGILIKTGGILNVVSLSQGQISDIRVNVGDIVEKGQVIARLSKPELFDRILSAKAQLEELKIQKQKATFYSEKGEELNLKYNEQQKKILEDSIKSLKEKAEWLEQKITAREKLFNEGLITKENLIRTKEEYIAVQQQIEQNESKIKQLSVQELQINKQKSQELLSLDQTINEIKKNIEILQQQLDLYSKIVTPYTGRIIEIKEKDGSIVNPGTPIISLERVGKEIKDLEAIIYVAPADGKKVKPGMDVLISPGSIKAEEYGKMLAKVTSVSEFPATFAGMMRSLNNSQLVQQLSGGGSPIQVTVDLIPDPETESGYKWSSGDGPPAKIHAGTICTADITIRYQKPIELVIPYIKNSLGLE